MQEQVKNFSQNQVLAAQSIKDRFGSGAISTLQAPINSQSFQFKYNFVTNPDGQPMVTTILIHLVYLTIPSQWAMEALEP